MLHEGLIEADQGVIVNALESGAATGDGRPLKRIDTHMSHLFLGETRVYKLKRSLRHPFADMSSVEARRQACEAELAVNRVLAPDIYEAVLPVACDRGRIRIGGPGQVIDWVVAMRRFPDGALFDELVQADALTAELVSEAVRGVADFHAGLPAASALGHTLDYGKIIHGLRRTEAEGAAAHGVRPASETLFGTLESELARLSPLIEARRDAGWVRRGQFSHQFEHGERTRRATITGLDYPKDLGAWFELSDGRRLETGHFEAIADASIGLPLGATIRLAKDDYRVVGLTQGLVDSAGDGLLFVSINDATAIASRRPSEQVLLARRVAGASEAGDSAGSSVPQDSKIAAVLVRLTPGADAAAVKAAVQRWGDANVLSKTAQRDLLLNQRLWRLRVQILAFASVLLLVTAIVISLIIYTLTMEKRHQIALLKLIGARNRVIVAMIAEQAVLIGLAGFLLALLLAQLVFPHFPRRIAILPTDLAMLFAILFAICGMASAFGISQALRVRAQEVLA